MVWHVGFWEAFGAAFWLGFGVNLVVAEVWINKTREKLPSNRPLQKTDARSATFARDAAG
jgi:hypothetical protein